MSFEVPDIERGYGQPSCDDVIWARVGGDGVSTGLPDTGGEVITLRVGCAIPVHDELNTTSQMSIDELMIVQERWDIPHRSERPLRELFDQLRTTLDK